jgi:hypothetical protein
MPNTTKAKIHCRFLAVSLYISTTKYTGRDSLFRRVAHPESADRERDSILSSSFSFLGL